MEGDCRGGRGNPAWGRGACRGLPARIGCSFDRQAHVPEFIVRSHAGVPLLYQKETLWGRRIRHQARCMRRVVGAALLLWLSPMAHADGVPGDDRSADGVVTVGRLPLRGGPLDF